MREKQEEKMSKSGSTRVSTDGKSKSSAKDGVAMRTKPWRSLEEQAGAGPTRLDKKMEFPVGADTWTEGDAGEGKVSRRTFLKTMAAPLAFAGLASCGVVRKPERKIYPYANAVESVIPGEPNYFATTMPSSDGAAVGLVVESHEGRPTKIEGNPRHPTSRGKTQTFQQASILDLYNPDRLQHIDASGTKVGTTGLDAWIEKLSLSTNEGAGVGILFPTQTSPTFYRLLRTLRAAYPRLRVYRYDAMNNDAVHAGLAEVTTSGGAGLPMPDLEQADVIVSLESDFLGLETGSLSYQQAFAAKRNPDAGTMNRLYQYESRFTLTGGMADHRFRLKRQDIEFVAYALLYGLYEKGISRIAKPFITLLENRVLSGLSGRLTGSPGYQAVSTVLNDVLANPGRAVFLAGRGQSPLVHAIVAYINGLISAPLEYYVTPFNQVNELKETSEAALARLGEDLSSGAVESLVNLGCDLLYTVPDTFTAVTNGYKRAQTLSLSLFPTATTTLSSLSVPAAHYLESWSDAVALDGTLSLVQPLIRPLYEEAHSATQILAKMITVSAGGESNLSGDETQWVQETHGFSEQVWRRTLHDGVAGDRYKRDTMQRLFVDPALLFEAVSKGTFLLKEADEAGLEVTFDFDYSVLDGRFFNNAWMQELPDPITKITWENVALISYTTAKKYGLASQDIARIRVGNKTIEAPIWVNPGQADDSISLALGYGQAYGSGFASGSGYDAYALRETGAIYVTTDVEVAGVGTTTKIASVQDHWAVEDEIFEGGASSNSQNDRPLYRSASLSEYEQHPDFAREAVEVPALPAYTERAREGATAGASSRADGMSIYEERPLPGEYQWGLDIDLGSCTGCNACVVACQAENNIPVVGKEMVIAGREMHWLRIDRYFDGDPIDPKMVRLPIMCMQCEQAPCEQVCPVAATVHSEEGLNDMVYNRCVGTRFCSNNCPYKVRRYNYLDYHGRSPHSQKRVSSHIFDILREPSATLQKQFNPDVTVRMRGVMEKCTYCVQRINAARITARNDDRKIQDGEIVTACEQACPSGSIVFGNIADKTSRVSKLKAEKRNYVLLEELNIKPRTSYRAAVSNPNPVLV